MKGQTSCTDERIDKHIEAQTDLIDRFVEEMNLQSVGFRTTDTVKGHTVIVYTVQVGTVEKARQGSEA
jgi:hypothetical protein